MAVTVKLAGVIICMKCVGKPRLMLQRYYPQALGQR